MNTKFLDALLTVLPGLPAVEIEALDPGRGWLPLADRRAEEGHRCALCRERVAVQAILIEPTLLSIYRYRWLDVCPRCRRGVDLMVRDWPGDDAAMKRFTEIHGEGALSA